MTSSDICWIRDIAPRRLAFGPRPRAGDWLTDEISGWSRAGIRHVVCLLEEHEVHELGITDEARLCSDNGIVYHPFPIVDRGVPASLEDAGALFEKIASFVAAGQPVFVHCRAGIGRSGLVAAAILVHLGLPFESAFATLSAARRLQVPDTQSQIDWTYAYATRVATKL
jgi:protein-tyrosine phosphatase